jgi:hypothetical protein
VLGYGVIKTDNNQPAVKPVAPVSIVSGYLVAGKQQPGIRPKGKRVLVFSLPGDIVLTGKCLEHAVIINVL